MMKNREKSEFAKYLMAAASVTALSVYSATAVAQDEPAPTSSGATEEMIVKGKFQQSLVDRIPISPQELPFTLDVLDRDFLDDRNFTRPIEALTTLPNVSIVNDLQNTGTPNFFARGFEAPVLVDNRVQNAFRGSGARDDSFVERYEVLRGPASISLGPVGSGGVFNTVTKSPLSEDFVGGKLRFDHFASAAVEIDANASSVFGSDAVAARISGAYRNFEFDADETERETMAIRPVVVFDFSDSTSAKVSASYVEHTVNPNKGFPLFSDGTIPANFDTDTFTGLANGEGKAEDIYYDLELNHQFLDNLKLTIRASHQTTDFDYQNTSGLYNYNYDDGSAGISRSNPIVYSYTYKGVTESENTFVDAQLAANFELWGQRQDFVIATSYNEDTFNRFFSPFPLVGPIDVSDVDTPRLGDETFGDVAPNVLSEGELFSVLGEAAIRPSDWLTIVAGVRYDDVDQSNIRFRRGVGAESGVVDEEVTFRIGASAAVTDNLNTYASYAESFTPQVGTGRDGAAVEPEFSEGYELGIKGNLLDGRLVFTAAVFRTERQNVAVSRTEIIPGEDPLFYYETIGEVRAQGFEFTSNFEPIDGLNLSLNYGFTDTDILEAGEAEDITTSAFPENTVSAFASYEIQSGSLQGLSLGGGLRYVDERPSLTPGIAFDSYTVVDLNASYPITDEVEVAFDVLNVADELYLDSNGGFTGRLTGQSTFGAPRTAVLTLRARF